MDRRSALACSVGLVLVSCADTSESNNPSLTDDSATITNWIEQNRVNLPTNYDDFGRLPWPYRRAVIDELSPEALSALMQEHLRHCIATRPGMTIEQRAVIDLARELMTPAWYAAKPEERQRIGGVALGPRSREAFDLPEFFRIFGSIGPEDAAIRALYNGTT